MWIYLFLGFRYDYPAGFIPFDDTFYSEWFVVGLVFTFPVPIVSFGYCYAEGDLLYPVFIIQTVMFVLTFFVLNHLLMANSFRLFLVKIKEIGEKRFLFSPMWIFVIVRIVVIFAVGLL